MTEQGRRQVTGRRSASSESGQMMYKNKEPNQIQKEINEL
jgi:hypothetical protein